MWNCVEFHQILWNFVKSHNILFNSVKVQKIYTKLTRKSQYLLNVIYFCPCYEKRNKVGQISFTTWLKVHSIYQNFSRCFTFNFNKILFHFVSFRTKIFQFTQILQIPINLMKLTELHTNFNLPVLMLSHYILCNYIFQSFNKAKKDFQKNCQNHLILTKTFHSMAILIPPFNTLILVS
jgi:hypothetical protein